MKLSNRSRWYLLARFYSRKEDITPQEYIRYLAYRIRDYEEEYQKIFNSGGEPSGYMSYLADEVRILNVAMYHAKQMRNICEGKKFPKERAMKYHKGMTVKLRGGAEIKGLGIDKYGNPSLGEWLWANDGSYFTDGTKDARDIVEVLSKPEPVKCTETTPVVGMLITSPGFLVPWEIKAVEAVKVMARPNSLCGRYYVLLTKVGNNPSLRVWEDLIDWTVEDNDGQA
jgi:hypothetical protein